MHIVSNTPAVLLTAGSSQYGRRAMNTWRAERAAVKVLPQFFTLVVWGAPCSLPAAWLLKWHARRRRAGLPEVPGSIARRGLHR
jgi:hypothetical protein